MNRVYLFAFAAGVLVCGEAIAAPRVSCAGAAMMGGAQLLCSNIDPGQVPETCNFSWSLVAMDGTSSVVQGSFRLPPGSTKSADIAQLRRRIDDFLVIIANGGLRITASALSNPLSVLGHRWFATRRRWFSFMQNPFGAGDHHFFMKQSLKDRVGQQICYRQ